MPKQDEERHALLESLSSLYDWYTYYQVRAALGSAELEDSFGSNPQLAAASIAIIEEISKYQHILGNQFLVPGYLVDGLKLVKTFGPGFHYDCLTGNIPGCEKQYASLIPIDLFKGIGQNKLASTITDLWQQTSYAHKVLQKADNNVTALTFILEGIKIVKPDVHDFIAAFASPTLQAKDTPTASEEYRRATDFLKILQDTLEEHKTFAEQLNERLYRLLINTTPYRNHLCKEKYPFLFD